ncbi:glycosyltransferase family 4 protein [Capnocytophaga sp.]|uniref:glycosyltransferase family 4 protein n=1 Tax=Capnocytophaga sp. TaxID=44737 RepID=UPI0026DBC256|nr:glycosyltransferase family 4 protein [Capnocytophaga sp.]MDO5104872.1 glycosyltransferase family 4 protein [Capnocytophaga sp.]
MRIIFLEVTQNLGGAQKSTLELAKRLKILGHEVLIVDLWGCSQSFIDAINAAHLQWIVLSPRKEPFIIANSSKLKYFKNIVTYFFLEKKYRSLFAKVTREFKPDVVVTHNTKALNLSDPNANYKIDFFARGWNDYRSLPRLSKQIFKRFHNIRFLTVSQATRQAVFTGGLAELRNIKVLTSVIETQVFNEYTPIYKPFNKENPIKILFSGGFLKTKGQHVCVEVAKKLKKIGIPFKMCLTGIVYKGEGSKKYHQAILNFIAKNDLKDCIDIALNPPNIMDYFKQYDVLIHPSATEGLPRVCLEALAFGKPVIANPVGGVTDVVIHNLTGFVTDFNAVDQYVDYIMRYADHQELYKAHSSNARLLIQQNYLDSNQFENIKQIYPI